MLYPDPKPCAPQHSCSDVLQPGGQPPQRRCTAACHRACSRSCFASLGPRQSSLPLKMSHCCQPCLPVGIRKLSKFVLPTAGRVKCWAFEPPGGMMTRVVSRALQPLCTSTALGKDWIPRLSVSSFERMRDDMVRVR